LRPGRFFGFPRVAQPDFESRLLQYVIDGDPIHARGLHDHRLDAARFQPFRHPRQIGCPTAELLHRLRIAPWRDRRKVAFSAYIDAGYVAMHHLQPRTVGVNPPHQFLALLAV
jgi:hypothetical protein